MYIDIDAIGEFLSRALTVVIYLSWLKHMSGLHFPWEECACCGEKYRDHRQDKGENDE